jgi:hypothetical protein
MRSSVTTTRGLAEYPQECTKSKLTQSLLACQYRLPMWARAKRNLRPKKLRSYAPALEATRLMIEKYRPGELTRYWEWYTREVRALWFAVDGQAAPQGPPPPIGE